MNLINNPGVVNVLGTPGQGEAQVEESPRLNWATRFLTVAYDGACLPNVLMFLSEWCEFTSAPCLAGKRIHDSSRIDVAEIARVS